MMSRYKDTRRLLAMTVHDLTQSKMHIICVEMPSH